MQLPNTDNSRQ